MAEFLQIEPPCSVGATSGRPRAFNERPYYREYRPIKCCTKFAPKSHQHSTLFCSSNWNLSVSHLQTNQTVISYECNKNRNNVFYYWQHTAVNYKGHQNAICKKANYKGKKRQFLFPAYNISYKINDNPGIIRNKSTYQQNLLKKIHLLYFVNDFIHTITLLCQIGICLTCSF